MWVASDSVVWEDGEVVDCEGGRVHVRSHDGRSLVISLQDNPPHLMNPDILVGANDLTSLSYLHEPAGNTNRALLRPLDHTLFFKA